MAKRAFFGVTAVLFAVSAAVTIVWCTSMPASMVWMRMPGQTWLGATASFLGMWVVMMVAMMLPSLAPMLWRDHQSVGGTMVVGIWYFFVWAMIGIAVYPIGVAVATLELRRPLAAGAVIVLAVAFQVAIWGARCPTFPRDGSAYWRHGLRLGLSCAYCCAGLMVILLVLGVSDLRAMAVVTAGITVVRLVPGARRTTHAVLHDTQST